MYKTSSRLAAFGNNAVNRTTTTLKSSGIDLLSIHHGLKNRQGLSAQE
jgi:hypothetical protein